MVVRGFKDSPGCFALFGVCCGRAVVAAAGLRVTKGSVVRKGIYRVVRGKDVVFEGLCNLSPCAGRSKMGVFTACTPTHTHTHRHSHTDRHKHMHLLALSNRHCQLVEAREGGHEQRWKGDGVWSAAGRLQRL